MTTTPYLELDDQATGANDNTWGDVADANFAILELAIARVLGIVTTGGTTTLTSAQNRYPIINVTGILASNGIIAVKTQEKNFIVINNTTGAYTLTVKTASGTGKTIPRGRACKVYCDGTNVLLAREQAIPAAQAGGTVDAITATFEPAFIAAEIQDGTMWLVEAGGANTVTNPTFTPDGVGGGYTIKKNGAQALAAADIPRIGYKCLFAYDASGGHVEMLNPAGIATESAPGLVEFATNAETVTGTSTVLATHPAGVAAAIAAAAPTIPAGSVFDYVGSTAPSGWLLLFGGTIGNAASGGTARANADTEDLFTLLWNSMADAQAPVSSGRGASAAADFAANKTITLPDARGRVIAGQDDMGGSSANRLTGVTGSVNGDTLGDTGGTETHTLVTAEIPSHSHLLDGLTGLSNGSETTQPDYAGSSDFSSTSAQTGSTGGGGAHNNVQPTLILNKIIKI